jgi:hypothetical protein
MPRRFLFAFYPADIGRGRLFFTVRVQGIPVPAPSK